MRAEVCGWDGCRAKKGVNRLDMSARVCSIPRAISKRPSEGKSPKFKQRPREFMKSPNLPSLIAFFAFLSTSMSAQTFTVLHSFTNSPDGYHPFGQLTLSGDVLYGTTTIGGTNSTTGIVYSVGTNGSNFNIAHTFENAVRQAPVYTNREGSQPYPGLVLSGNKLFGHTAEGGTNGTGTVFSLSTDGVQFTVIHTFTPIVNGAEGADAIGGLVLYGNRLYGTAVVGGTGANGTIFSLDTNGSNFTVLHAFSSGNPNTSTLTNFDGANPRGTLLLLGETIFGTAQRGGTNTGGTVFSMSTNGSNFVVLHSFGAGSDGAGPSAALILSGNTLFGTTQNGGVGASGTVFSVGVDGSNYQILHAFHGASDGSLLNGPLTLCGTMLYGTTALNGPNGHGTVFYLSTNGSIFGTIHSFSGSDGAAPEGGGMILSGNMFYGTTYSGGSANGGTVFSLTVPCLATTITQNPDASVTLNFAGAPNYTYLVQASTDLSSPTNWITISTNTPAADGTWQFTDTNTSLYPAQYYRATTP